MKYISGYKNFINDLEDYLQEIFDKYSIKSFMTPPVFHNGKWHDCPYYRKFENFIHINNTEEIFKNLLQDVIKLIPTIEKRLGHQIEIEYYGHKRGNKIFNINDGYLPSGYLTIFTGEPSLKLRSDLGLY